MTKINESILSHLRKDKILTKIIDKYELPKRNKPSNIYHALFNSIVSQQLSIKAAGTIQNRLISHFKGDICPANVIAALPDELRACGLSTQKVNYVKNVAYFFKDRSMKNSHWKGKEDDEIVQELTAIKGVGKWTAQMVLMFSLGRPDVFPFDDLIIRNSMIQYYDLNTGSATFTNDIHEVADKWRPYRSYACFYFWAAKDDLNKMFHVKQINNPKI